MVRPARLGTSLADVGSVLEEIAGLRARRAVRVRFVAPRLAAKVLLAPKLGQFARDHPEVVLEVTADDSP
jgi:DNA-binding transcriptional LysR family regulator